MTMGLVFLLIAAGVIWFLLKKTGDGTSHTAQGKNQPPPSAAREAALRLTYQDFEGNQTTRDVSPYTRATNERFRAYCHLRKEAREFVFARVQGGVDLQTGEVLDRAGVFRHIHPTRNVPEDLL